MKIPQTLPPWNKLIAEQEDLFRILGLGPLVRDRYLHWDELRHRTPPEGLSHEAWWAGVRLARRGVLKSLPFQDKNKRPIQFGMPDPVLKMLRVMLAWSCQLFRVRTGILSGEFVDRGSDNIQPSRTKTLPLY